MYKLTYDDSILRTTDFAWIPADEGNTDYQQYLAWLADGNVPEPAGPILMPQINVSPRQIRQALTRAGWRDEVETAILHGGQDLKDWWEFATVFEEDHQEVILMCGTLGKTDQERHDLFTLAASL